MSGLKPKSMQVLDIMAGNPKLNNTDAYLQVHNTSNRVTATTNAYKLLQKPEAKIYLEKHIDKAKNTVVKLLDAEKDDIRLRAATDILDRTQGKAIQQIQATTTGVQININLNAIDEVDSQD